MVYVQNEKHKETNQTRGDIYSHLPTGGLGHFSNPGGSGRILVASGVSAVLAGHANKLKAPAASGHDIAQTF